LLRIGFQGQDPFHSRGSAPYSRCSSCREMRRLWIAPTVVVFFEHCHFLCSWSKREGIITQSFGKLNIYPAWVWVFLCKASQKTRSAEMDRICCHQSIISNVQTRNFSTFSTWKSLWLHRLVYWFYCAPQTVSRAGIHL